MAAPRRRGHRGRRPRASPPRARMNHRTSQGELTPTLTAADDELVGIARAVGATGTGVLQVVSDFADVDAEFGLFRAMAEAVGPAAVVLAGRRRSASTVRRACSSSSSRPTPTACRCGARPRPAPSASSSACSARSTRSSATRCSARSPGCSVAEQARAMADPSFRERVLEQARRAPGMLGAWDRMFELGDPPDYEPDPSTSVAARATPGGPRAGRPRATTSLAPTTAGRSSTCRSSTGSTATLDAVRRDARPRAHRARPVRRRRPRRHDLRRQLPHDAAQPVGPRPRRGPPAARRTSCSSTRATPLAPSACSTAACSPPATGATATSSTSTRLQAPPPRDAPRPARRRPPPAAARRRLRRHGQGAARSPTSAARPPTRSPAASCAAASPAPRLTRNPQTVRSSGTRPAWRRRPSSSVPQLVAISSTMRRPRPLGVLGPGCAQAAAGGRRSWSTTATVTLRSVHARP